MQQYKKFIAPDGWFAMEYPASWCEFEDTENTFLFYNPERWTGNFRISAYRGHGAYAREVMEQELREAAGAVQVMLGGHRCVYSQTRFEEEGVAYVTHFWVTGEAGMALECSFTLPCGGSTAGAEGGVASLEVRHPGRSYPVERGPVRLTEIYRINEAYSQVERLVKERLNKDFQGTERDVESMQQLIDRDIITDRKRDAWVALGVVLCVILSNEEEGWEWRVQVDGAKATLLLERMADGTCIDPAQLVWGQKAAGGSVSLTDIYAAL